MVKINGLCVNQEVAASKQSRKSEKHADFRDITRGTDDAGPELSSASVLRRIDNSDMV